ncbi:hypothetical protein F2Q70_00007263 [Brassica cretica]|uniref:Uncharacterized protein n=1 Tax=Brassica cretica TaxID=69181 RepID=A0A8S9M5D9_BRACR|nr:hypothetical protein F2Q70_00007263 [Brassica cretica]
MQRDGRREGVSYYLWLPFKFIHQTLRSLLLKLFGLRSPSRHTAASLGTSSSVLEGFERVMVLVLLTVTSSVRPSLTFQHYMGLIELLVVVCEAIVCRMSSVYGVRKLPPVLLGSTSCTGRIRT